MDGYEAWKQFEKTGKIDDYMNYINLNAFLLEEEEGYPYGFENQRDYFKATPYRRTGQDHYDTY